MNLGWTLFVTSQCDVQVQVCSTLQDTGHSGLQPTFWRSLLTQHAYLAAPEQR